MSEKKQVTTTTTPSLFDKQNMWLMLLGVGVIAIGMLLMVGGRSKDPNTF
jgi:LPXTG-motif cell wall-anchored protein